MRIAAGNSTENSVSCSLLSPWKFPAWILFPAVDRKPALENLWWQMMLPRDWTSPQVALCVPFTSLDCYPSFLNRTVSAYLVTMNPKVFQTHQYFFSSLLSGFYLTFWETVRQTDFIVILAYNGKGHTFRVRTILTARKSIRGIHTDDPAFYRLANVHSGSIPNSIVKKIRESIFVLHFKYRMKEAIFMNLIEKVKKKEHKQKFQLFQIKKTLKTPDWTKQSIF